MGQPFVEDEKERTQRLVGVGAGVLCGIAAGVVVGLTIGGLAALVIGLLVGALVGAVAGELIISRMSPEDWEPPPTSDRPNVGLHAPDADGSDPGPPPRS
jgi:xanthine/uracil permease